MLQGCYSGVTGVLQVLACHFWSVIRACMPLQGCYKGMSAATECHRGVQGRRRGNTETMQSICQMSHSLVRDTALHVLDLHGI